MILMLGLYTTTHIINTHSFLTVSTFATLILCCLYVSVRLLSCFFLRLAGVTMYLYHLFFSVKKLWVILRSFFSLLLSGEVLLPILDAVCPRIGMNTIE